jgi:ubiquinone/menaquinone biosynthesis C-methylase UbiE
MVTARMTGESPYLDPQVASAYACLAAPSQFTRPARDLVGLLDVSIGARVLDVGSGTGVVARALAQAVGAAGTVIAVDPSVAMLSTGGPQPPYYRVVAGLPDLPFPDAAFDAIVASFVISHLASYADGLADMVRTCKSGGRVGVTAWGTLPNPVGALWTQVAMTIEGSERLSEVFRSLIPWDEWLSRSDNLEYALHEAGLAHVAIMTRDFVVSVAAAEYLAMKGATVEGTLLRRMLTAERWAQFTREAMETFRTRFGEVVEFTRDFLIGIGTKA